MVDLSIVMSTFTGEYDDGPEVNCSMVLTSRNMKANVHIDQLKMHEYVYYNMCMCI